LLPDVQLITKTLNTKSKSGDTYFIQQTSTISIRINTIKQQ
jgi:hypothetical protein